MASVGSVVTSRSVKFGSFSTFLAFFWFEKRLSWLKRSYKLPVASSSKLDKAEFCFCGSVNHGWPAEVWQGHLGAAACRLQLLAMRAWEACTFRNRFLQFAIAFCSFR